MSERPVVFHRGKFVEATEPWHLCQHEFLTHFASGVYTVTRTVDQRLFNLPLHLQRLVFGLYKEKQEDDKFTEQSPDYQTTKIRLNDLLKQNIKLACRYFLSQQPEVSDHMKTEMKITLLMEPTTVPERSVDELEEHLWVLVLPLYVKTFKSVEIQIREHQRETPDVKSINWVHQREELEKSLPSQLEECILCHNNQLYEGLSSNFFVVNNGTIYTAPEGSVLAGSIMQLALESCSKLNIPVIREFPSLETINSWEGCFITSTSREVLPVHRVYWLKDNQEQSMNIPLSPLVDKLRTMVHDTLLQVCEPIL